MTLNDLIEYLQEQLGEQGNVQLDFQSIELARASIDSNFYAIWVSPIEPDYLSIDEIEDLLG